MFYLDSCNHIFNIFLSLLFYNNLILINISNLYIYYKQIEKENKHEFSKQNNKGD